MLGKYLKRLFQPGKAEDSTPIAEVVLSPAAAPITPNVGVNTGHLPSGNVVARVLDVPTDGQRTNPEKLRQKFISRQPVLDRGQHLVGYELMLRNKFLPARKEPDGALRQLHDETLLSCIAQLNVGSLLGGKQAFISLSPAVLENSLLDNLTQHSMVLAVSPVGEDQDAVLLRCRQLRALGYKIALEDAAYAPLPDDFLEVADYVRVDVARIDAIELAQRLDQIRRRFSPQFVAHNVDTDEVFEACRKLDFHLFQGYYFARLQPTAPSRMDSNRLHVMELLNLVRTRAGVPELEEVFRRDPVLTYKLLLFMNAPVNGLLQEVQSIAHVIMLLGYEQLYRWLTLLLFTSGAIDPRNRALLKNALVRARLTELLGRGKLSPAERDGLFIVGIFSLLDVLLNVPMAQALDRLHLSEPVMRALSHHDGVYAPFLDLAVACEEGDEETIAKQAQACGFDAETLNRAHVEALVWADEIDR